MGIVQVTVTIRNPAEPDRTWDGLFRLDAGSTDCVAPGNALRGIGLAPKGRRTYALADGRKQTVDITPAEVEFMGEIVGATVGFGPDDVEPILGLTALASVGIEIDPVSQRLMRRPAVRMKTEGRAAAWARLADLMGGVSAKAAANGLTEARLEALLADES